MFIDYFKENKVKMEVLSNGEYYFFFNVGWFVAKAQRFNSEPDGKGITYYWLIERSEQISNETIEKYIRKAESGTEHYKVTHAFRYKNEENKPMHELPYNINITISPITNR